MTVQSPVSHVTAGTPSKSAGARSWSNVTLVACWTAEPATNCASNVDGDAVPSTTTPMPAAAALDMSTPSAHEASETLTTTTSYNDSSGQEVDGASASAPREAAVLGEFITAARGGTPDEQEY
jgi:hypothetical protein